MEHPVLLSIQVGRPVQYGTAGAADPLDRPWSSAFHKRAIAGPVRLGRTNLEGDAQADVVHHGGPDKAVLAYSADHYALWRAELGLPALPFGAFGENFTIRGAAEPDVCLGDLWRIGEAVVQVSQPRQPCWKLARRWRIVELPARVQETGRTGWYLRVLREGELAAGAELHLVERPHPGWSVARANRVMHVDRDDLCAAEELAALPALSASWQETLRRRIAGKRPPDVAARLHGPNGE